MSGFQTIADICDSEGVSAHRVEYIIDAKRIKPMGKIGPTRIFSDESAALIRAELARIDRWHAESRCIGDQDQQTPAPTAKPAPAVVS